MDYAGGIEYKDEVLESVFHSEGRVTANWEGSNEGSGQIVYRHEYTLKDHLGNSRIIFSDLNEDGKLTIGGEDSEILQEEHYYPFGMEMEGNWAPQVGVKNGYLYNETEHHEDFELNVNTTFFRTYDPAIARWWQVDPLAEVMPDYSPYNFSFNSPINYADPLGNFPNPLKWIKRLLCKNKVACRSGAGGNKKKGKIPKGKRQKKKKNQQKKPKDNEHKEKTRTVQEWHSEDAAGESGSITRYFDENNSVKLPTLTYTIPELVDSDYPIRVETKAYPNRHTLGGYPVGWSAMVNDDINKNMMSGGGEAFPGDRVTIFPILTDEDRKHLKAGGKVSDLDIGKRLRTLKMSLVVYELRVYHVRNSKGKRIKPPKKTKRQPEPREGFFNQ